MMMKKHYEIIMGYPKLSDFMQLHSKTAQEATTIIDEIHGEFNKVVADYTIKMLDNSLRKLYHSVNLDCDPDMDLKTLKEDYHIVLVPNHQSHADYIALNYLLYKRFDVPIHVAGGINLNIFPIGTYFRNMGAFFIRRSFTKDLLYKHVFEAYIYYLLKENMIVEFFFEGGRSRTGKLLPPRFGLFQMLLEAHGYVHSHKPLMFIPVSIAHEHVPEEKAHERELSGAKKQAEKTTQLFKLLKLVNKKFGSIHVRLGEGIVVKQFDDIKTKTQDLALECFNRVGAGMPVTPTSLLALIMLDEPSGTMTWEQIEEKSKEVMAYCQRFSIPLTPSLADEKFDVSLKEAFDTLIANKKVQVIEREKLNQTYYAIKKEHRIKMNYFKNMILHHFLVPCLINNAWFQIFNGNVSTVNELVRLLSEKRRELKFEFYLPSVKEMFVEAMDVISYAVGRKVTSLDECLKLSSTELYQIASKVSPFSTALTYIYEAYYLSLCAIRHLQNTSFSQEKFLQVAKELHSIEMDHGRVVKYLESNTVPTLKDSLLYFFNLKLLEKSEDGLIRVIDDKKLGDLIEKFAHDISNQVVVNLKFNRRDNA